MSAEITTSPWTCAPPISVDTPTTDRSSPTKAYFWK
jgi:hypothetical protein